MSDMRSLLARFGLRPNGDLGQNFLADGNMVRALAAAVPAEPGETVVEIGPGLGALTLALTARGLRVYAVELDRGLAAALGVLAAEAGVADRVRIEHGDATAIAWDATARALGRARLCVAGNLPYQVSSPLLFALLEARAHVRAGAFMLQKEVADRLTAAPGTAAYGTISVRFARAARVRRERIVPAACFYPAPRVDSAFVVIEFPDPAPVAVRSDAAFAAVVRAAFGRRRKQLPNALETLGLPAAVVRAALAAAEIDPRLRAEALAPAVFARLADALEPALAAAGAGDDVHTDDGAA